jgi:hypothetical protein
MGMLARRFVRLADAAGCSGLEGAVTVVSSLGIKAAFQTTRAVSYRGPE